MYVYSYYDSTASHIVSIFFTMSNESSHKMAQTVNFKIIHTCNKTNKHVIRK